MNGGSEVFARHVEEFRAWAENEVNDVVGEIQSVRCDTGLVELLEKAVFL
jgi:hypothetical protein